MTKAWRVLGKPWRLVIVDRLSNGPRTFNQLLFSMPGISTRTLSKALKELKSAGIVTMYCSGKNHYYSLTEMGKELIPIVNAIKAWSIKWLSGKTLNINIR